MTTHLIKIPKISSVSKIPGNITSVSSSSLDNSYPGELLAQTNRDGKDVSPTSDYVQTTVFQHSDLR